MTLLSWKFGLMAFLILPTRQSRISRISSPASISRRSSSLRTTRFEAVELDATVLYADLADSTGLVQGYKDWFAAEVYKTYLMAASELIKNNDGTITAFDGDRVMGVFIGGSKNSSAARCALQINHFV